MNYGLANTGSLVGDQTDIMQRLASSLSWINIAIVATSNIIADMPSLMTKMTPKETGYIAFITVRAALPTLNACSPSVSTALSAWLLLQLTNWEV